METVNPLILEIDAFLARLGSSQIVETTKVVDFCLDLRGILTKTEVVDEVKTV